ncbi:DUF6514 family protein [Clostridium sp. SHJSY1]|uniref:DUF6514 family protein n=1 Tax=Clostridium sp. SHJSY1 TaxID=2942483 RepID=UPI002875F7EE|nr:DUF6514 family protein [Clostridium sp. SHJSY1]MDS0526210.1 DUF6514 family protein [Clostridium sp. SHJSY1]
MLVNREVITKDSSGMERKYIYKITEEVLEGIKEYGIEVIREDTELGLVTNNVRSEVKSISHKKENVSKILHVLSRNEVSPIHLLDVVEEYIDKSSYI